MRLRITLLLLLLLLDASLSLPLLLLLPGPVRPGTAGRESRNQRTAAASARPSWHVARGTRQACSKAQGQY